MENVLDTVTVNSRSAIQQLMGLFNSAQNYSHPAHTITRPIQSKLQKGLTQLRAAVKTSSGEYGPSGNLIGNIKQKMSLGIENLAKGLQQFRLSKTDQYQIDHPEIKQQIFRKRYVQQKPVQQRLLQQQLSKDQEFQRINQPLIQQSISSIQKQDLITSKDNEQPVVNKQQFTDKQGPIINKGQQAAQRGQQAAQRGQQAAKRGQQAAQRGQQAAQRGQQAAQRGQQAAQRGQQAAQRGQQAVINKQQQPIIQKQQHKPVRQDQPSEEQSKQQLKSLQIPQKNLIEPLQQQNKTLQFQKYNNLSLTQKIDRKKQNLQQDIHDDQQKIPNSDIIPKNKSAKNSNIYRIHKSNTRKHSLIKQKQAELQLMANIEFVQKIKAQSSPQNFNLKNQWKQESPNKNKKGISDYIKKKNMQDLVFNQSQSKHTLQKSMISEDRNRQIHLPEIKKTRQKGQIFKPIAFSIYSITQKPMEKFQNPKI